MKKNLNKILFILFLLNLHIFGAEIDIEGRSAAFFHSSKHFRDTYGNVGGCYAIEASTTLEDCWSGWANLDWFSRRGHSVWIWHDDRTRVKIANLSVGIKYDFKLNDRFTAYIGIGPSLARVSMKNKWEIVHHHFSKFAFGGIAKGGFDYFMTDYIFLNFFVDYLYQPVHFHSRMDIGGTKVGGGIGIRF